MTTRWTRRRFIQAAGVGLGAGMGATLLPLIPKGAATDGFPLRLVLLTNGNGVIFNDWRPTGGETDFELSPILGPLERHRDNLLILDGVDNDAALSNDGVQVHKDPSIESSSHHSHAILFTGRNLTHGPYTISNVSSGQGPSVDHVIAEHIGGETPRQLVHVGMGDSFGLGSLDPRHKAFYRAANSPHDLITNPVSLFDHLFAGVDGASSGAAEAAARRRAERRSVLDVVSGELGRVRGEIPTSERPLVDAHLAAIRDIERRLSGEVATCVTPEAPPTRFDRLWPENDDIPAFVDMQFDLVAAALRCDVTRVVGMQYGHEGGGEVFTWLPTWTSRANQHSQGHENTTEARRMLSDAGRYHTTKFAYFLDRLREVPEGSGTLLDNTVVVWAHPLTEGWTHANRNIPLVIAAGRNTPFRTGRLVRWGDYFRSSEGTMVSGGGSRKLYRGGVSMSSLLVTLCRAFGLTGIDSFGDGPAGSLDEDLLA